MEQGLRGEMQEMEQGLRSDNQETRQESREGDKSLRAEMKEFREEFNRRCDSLAAGLEVVSKRQNSQFAILMTTMISLAGVVIAVVKL